MTETWTKVRISVSVTMARDLVAGRWKPNPDWNPERYGPYVVFDSPHPSDLKPQFPGDKKARALVEMEIPGRWLPLVEADENGTLGVRSGRVLLDPLAVARCRKARIIRVAENP